MGKIAVQTCITVESLITNGCRAPANPSVDVGSLIRVESLRTHGRRLGATSHAVEGILANRGIRRSRLVAHKRVKAYGCIFGTGRVREKSKSPYCRVVSCGIDP